MEKVIVEEEWEEEWEEDDGMVTKPDVPQADVYKVINFVFAYRPDDKYKVIEFYWPFKRNR